MCSRPIPLCAYKKAKTGEAPMGEELLVSAQAGCEYARRLLCEELLQRANAELRPLCWRRYPWMVEELEDIFVEALCTGLQQLASVSSLAELTETVRKDALRLIDKQRGRGRRRPKILQQVVSLFRLGTGSARTFDIGMAHSAPSAEADKAAEADKVAEADKKTAAKKRKEPAVKAQALPGITDWAVNTSAGREEGPLLYALIEKHLSKEDRDFTYAFVAAELDYRLLLASINRDPEFARSLGFARVPITESALRLRMHRIRGRLAAEVPARAHAPRPRGAAILPDGKDRDDGSGT